MVATDRQVSRDIARRRLERSQSAAASIITAVQRLTTDVSTAIANASPPQIAEATRRFMSEVNATTPQITDPQVRTWLVDHCRFAMNLGGFSAPPAVPDQALFNAFTRHEGVVLSYLTAHAGEGEYLESARAPLGDREALLQWIPWNPDDLPEVGPGAKPH